MRADFDETSDDSVDIRNLPKILGLHPELIREIRKALQFYSQALDGMRIGLSILAVNPVIRKLHLSAITNKCSGVGQAFTFKPLHVKVKSLKTTILAGFVGKATPEYLMHLNAKHDAQLGELPPRHQLRRKQSLSSGRLTQFRARRNTSASDLLHESKDTDEFMFYENLPLKFPLSHFCSLCKQKIIRITNIKLQDTQLHISFSEQQYSDYSSDGKVIAHKKIQNGVAKAQLSEQQKKSLEKELRQHFSYQSDLCMQLRNSSFYTKHKNSLVLDLLDDELHPMMSLGVTNRNGNLNDVDDTLIISDVDLHLAFSDLELSSGEVLRPSPRSKKNLFDNPENSSVGNLLKTICQMYMDSDHDEFRGFNWSSFVEQVKLGSGMGYISAQEFLLLTFINHFCGRGRLGVITRVIQHGPASRLPRHQIGEESAKNMTNYNPQFPAINQSTEVGVLYSTGEFQHYRGVSLLAFYATLLENDWSVACHPIWLKQIRMCNDPDFDEEKKGVYENLIAQGIFATERVSKSLIEDDCYLVAREPVNVPDKESSCCDGFCVVM